MPVEESKGKGKGKRLNGEPVENEVAKLGKRSAEEAVERFVKRKRLESEEFLGFDEIPRWKRDIGVPVERVDDDEFGPF